MYNTHFHGREPIKKPECPFCGSLLIDRPTELTTRRPGDMPVGSCSCGAVYACDESGRNMGSALIEALVFGCDMDWDLAWGLDPEEDYRWEVIDNYDLNHHIVIPGGFYEGRRIAGALFFVRLHKDVQEVTSESVKNRLARVAHASPKKPPKRSRKDKALTKKMVEKLVKDYHIEPILDAVWEDKKIIRYLQRLLYSGDDLFRRRAAETLGKACAIVGESDPGIASKLLQGLFYSITDTAAFAPGAFEAIGEIISQRADLYAGYVAQLYQFLADETRKVQAIQAISRIAKASPAALRKHTFYFFQFLEDPDPTICGYTTLLMGNLGAFEAKGDIEKLVQETHEIEIYENGQFVQKTVGQIASEALSRF